MGEKTPEGARKVTPVPPQGSSRWKFLARALLSDVPDSVATDFGARGAVLRAGLRLDGAGGTHHSEVVDAHGYTSCIVRAQAPGLASPAKRTRAASYPEIRDGWVRVDPWGKADNG